MSVNGIAEKIDRKISRQIEKRLLLIFLVGFIFVTVIWGPVIINLLKGTTPEVHRIERRRPLTTSNVNRETLPPSSSTLQADEKPFDFKTTLTWLIGTMNSIIIMLIGFKKLTAKK